MSSTINKVYEYVIVNIKAIDKATLAKVNAEMEKGIKDSIYSTYVTLHKPGSIQGGKFLQLTKLKK